MKDFSTSEIEFTPHYVTWACPSCDQDFKKKDCISNGRYCAMNHRGSQYVNGKDILMEDLREYCLYKTLKAKNTPLVWWEYMGYVHKMCYGEVNEECSKLGHKYINLNYQDTMNCVRETFEGPNYEKDDNKVMREETKLWKKYGSGYFPAVVINDRTYRGDLIPDNVFAALCSGFATAPKVCKLFADQQSHIGEPEGITGTVLVFVVVFLVLVNVAMIYLYRRCTKKELKDDMQLQVNSAVSQYFALSTKNTSMSI